MTEVRGCPSATGEKRGCISIDIHTSIEMHPRFSPARGGNQVAARAFSEDVVKAAWVRSRGKCECMDFTRCRHSIVPHWRELAWNARGDDNSMQGWEAHHIDPDGEPDLSNCRILCIECHKNTPTYGTGRENPILIGLLALVDAGQQVVRVSSGWNATPRPNAVFHLKDGSVRKVEFDADHSTYMRLWKQAAAFKHLLSEAELPPDA